MRIGCSKLERLLKAEILPPTRQKIYITAQQAAKLQTVVDTAIEANCQSSRKEPELGSSPRRDYSRILVDLEARKARRTASDQPLAADHSEAAE